MNGGRPTAGGAARGGDGKAGGGVTIRHLVQMSGGAGSWATAKRVVDRHGPDDVTLVFADTLIEDGDCYRFLIEGSCNVMGVEAPSALLATVQAMPEAHEDIGVRKATLADLRKGHGLPFLHWIAEGRTPHEVFRDERMLGNTRFDPCSKLLKRQLLDRWKQEYANPDATVCYVGIDWSERHRYEALRDRWEANGGWRYEAPMCHKPWLTKDDVFAWIRREGMAIPRLYDWGMSHNNCGGGCVKAGHGHWVKLLRMAPDRFAWWEEQEEEMRRYLGRDVSMLTDRAGGDGKKPMTLRALRERVRAGGQVDLFDMGGCGCALPSLNEGIAA